MGEENPDACLIFFFLLFLKFQAEVANKVRAHHELQRDSKDIDCWGSNASEISGHSGDKSQF
jgi:hypothetical protein